MAVCCWCVLTVPACAPMFTKSVSSKHRRHRRPRRCLRPLHRLGLLAQGITPNMCTCPVRPPFVPDTPSRSGYRCISAEPTQQTHFNNAVPSTMHRGSFGLTLITGTFGLKRDDSWLSTSATRCVWCSFLRIFMMRTIAAWMSIFRSSSMYLCVASCSTFSSVFSGMLMLMRSFLLW